MQIQRDVIQDLAARLPAMARSIGVMVRDGVVTLTGQLEADAARYEAEQAAQGIEGVQALADEIVVHIPGSVSRADSDIALAVLGILQCHAYLPLAAVTVSVRHGWITLGGEVERDYPRQKIHDALALLVGVRGIRDNVLVKSTAALSAVRADVLSAMRQRSELDARDVVVEVQGSQVTLSGSVHNWWEREMARRSAWSAAGVRQVVDHLAIHS
jgi:osmotically-inducible protein OsmY